MILRSCALLAALCLPSVAQTSQWRVLPIRSQAEFTQGLVGGEGEQYLHSMARCYYHPEYVYLGHDVGGSWRSTDAGRTWTKSLDKGLPLSTTTGIAVDPSDPSVVLILVDNSFNWLSQGDEGLYRSVDGGQSWTRVLAVSTNYDASKHRMFHATIAFDPATADSLTPATRWYAGVHNGGLYRSDDGGRNWSTSAVSSLAGHASVHVVCPHPSDGRTVYVGTSQGLLLSDSLGSALHPAGNLPTGEVTSVFVNPRTPAQIFAVVKGSGLYRSVDSGVTFTLARALNAAHVFANPAYPSVMFLIAQTSGSLVTHNGGASWNALATATTFPGLGRESGWRRSWDGDICAVMPNPRDSLEAVAHSRSTMFRTVNGGRAIAESATGFTGNAWGWYNSSIAFDRADQGRIALFCYDVGMRLTLNGGDWFEENTNAQAWTWYQAHEIGWMGTYAGSFLPVPGSRTIVEAIGDYWSTRVARSTDNGGLWQLWGDTSSAALNLFVAFDPDSPAVVYAGGRISRDSGMTFSSVNFGGTYTRPEVVGMCARVPRVLYAMDHDRRVLLRSSDRGLSWREYSRPGWAMRKLDPLPTFAAHPLDTQVVYSIDGAGDLAVFDGVAWRSLGVRSLAGGPSWNHVRRVAVDPHRPEVVYAGMFAAGSPCVLRSVNAGTTWTDVSANVPRLGAGAMAVNPHTSELWMGGVAGTWILNAPDTPVIPVMRSPAVPARPASTRLGLTGRLKVQTQCAGRAYDLRGRSLHAVAPATYGQKSR